MDTPEKKVKAAVKEFLHSRKVQSLTHPIEGALGFYWMPVPSGMGSSFLDFVICYRGYFVGAEAKASMAKNPTPRQRLLLSMIVDAGGTGCWGDDLLVDILEKTFDEIDRRATW